MTDNQSKFNKRGLSTRKMPKIKNSEELVSWLKKTNMVKRVDYSDQWMIYWSQKEWKIAYSEPQCLDKFQVKTNRPRWVVIWDQYSKSLMELRWTSLATIILMQGLCLVNSKLNMLLSLHGILCLLRRIKGSKQHGSIKLMTMFPSRIYTTNMVMTWS